MSSNAQITANQLNAQQSTGPTTPDGKAASALNALKHGLYSEARVLPGENPDQLAALDRDFRGHFDPQGPVENGLVELLVRSQWQQYRYDRIESIVTWKYVADSGKSEDEALADLYLQTKNNPLTRLQQRREAAQRHWFRALKELQRLQKARGRREPADPSSPSDKIGFVPSTPPENGLPAWKLPVPTPSRPAENRNPAIK